MERVLRLISRAVVAAVMGLVWFLALTAFGVTEVTTGTAAVLCAWFWFIGGDR